MPDSTIGPANRTTPPYSSTIAAVKSSMCTDAALCRRRKISARSSGFDVPYGKRTFGRRDGAPCIFLVAQRDVSNHSTVSGADYVYDLAAVRFDELAINVVRRDCLHGVGVCCRFHGALPLSVALRMK